MTRAVSTVLGVLLLTVVAVVLAGAASLVVLDAAVVADEPEPTLPVELEASVTVTENHTRILLLHRSGPTLDVEGIDVRIAVDGTPLRHQPDVPFFGATGFTGGPSGPFSGFGDSRWELGERAGLKVANSNDPTITPGVTVRIELYRDELPLARVETTAY